MQSSWASLCFWAQLLHVELGNDVVGNDSASSAVAILAHLSA